MDAAGATALVGAARDIGGGVTTGSGAAYVFVKPGSGWMTATSDGKLMLSDGADRDLFGFPVALDATGRTALVGALFHDVDTHVDQGAAYVFV